MNIAVDLGTTNIEFALVDGAGRVIGTFTCKNSQARFGRDVISRIQAANDGALAELNRLVLGDLLTGFFAVCNSADVELVSVKTIAIAGNTTMLHILLNTSCETLGVDPYVPVFVDAKRLSFEEVFGILQQFRDTEIIILPGISTFVGADVVAGFYHCRDFSNTGLLIDLGTNGEIIMWNGDTITATAAAAGPAFEYLGIYGSKFLDIAAGLVTDGIIDPGGRIVKPTAKQLEISPGIKLTQQDIRELQLAKSAIRAGVEILMDGVSAPIYLAGGFGENLNLNSAKTLGILPQNSQNMYAVGNSSLAGVVKLLTDLSSLDKMAALAKHATEINLSNHPDFNDVFMNYLQF